MPQRHAQVDRSRLKFAEAVRAEFAFLFAAPFQFELKESTPELVRIDSARVGLVVFHDRLSYELGVLMCPSTGASGVDRPYGLPDLMRATDAATARQYRAYMATTEDAVRAGLRQLAKDLRRYGESALKGDPAFFAAIDRAREAAIAEFGAKFVREQACSLADRAWAEGDFARVVEAYEGMKPDLSPSEQARLAYAAKHAGEHQV